MTDQEPSLPPLGALLENARTHLKISKREAARRAGISEARWRQVVTGLQNTRDRGTPSNPRAVTVAAMARAVDLDPDEALRVAGLDPLPHARQVDANDAGDSAIRRVLLSDLSVDQKERIVEMLLGERQEAERRLRARVDELIAEQKRQG